MLVAGLFGAVFLGFSAMRGPSAAKAQNRRLESVRERHSKSNEVATQAQLKRLLANRTQNRMDGLAQRFIPKPALLKARLHQTGKTWSLGQYAMACLAIVLVVTLLLATRGMPMLLAVLVGL